MNADLVFVAACFLLMLYGAFRLGMDAWAWAAGKIKRVEG